MNEIEKRIELLERERDLLKEILELKGKVGDKHYPVEPYPNVTWPVYPCPVYPYQYPFYVSYTDKTTGGKL